VKKRIIGIIVIIASIAIISALIYGLWPDNAPRITFTKQSMTSLTQDDLVKINGATIGKVEKIENADDGLDIIVRLEKKTKIPKESEIIEMRSSLLGDRILQISTKGKCTTFYNENDKITISEPENQNRNILGDILTTPEKIDSILAILRRIESKK